MDGEWEAPQIANPKCESAPGCGAWQRPTIDNPNYKGKWKAPMIDNPNYQVNYLVLQIIFHTPISVYILCILLLFSAI